MTGEYALPAVGETLRLKTSIIYQEGVLPIVIPKGAEFTVVYVDDWEDITVKYGEWEFSITDDDIDRGEPDYQDTFEHLIPFINDFYRTYGAYVRLLVQNEAMLKLESAVWPVAVITNMFYTYYKSGAGRDALAYALVYRIVGDELWQRAEGNIP